MGAWNDIELSVDTLKGLSAVDWPSSMAQADVDVNLVKAAKGTVAPLVTPRVSTFVAEAGSTEAFFDLAAAESALASEIQAMLGYAYLHHQFIDRAVTSRGNRDHDRALVFFDPTMEPPRGMLIGAVKAFATLVPVVLGMTTDASGVERAVPAMVVAVPDTKPITIGTTKVKPFSFDIT